MRKRKEIKKGMLEWVNRKQKNRLKSSGGGSGFVGQAALGGKNHKKGGSTKL